MKKLMWILIAVFLSCPAAAIAAGVTDSGLVFPEHEPNEFTLTYTAIADGAGAFPVTATRDRIEGHVYSVKVFYGTTAPTTATTCVEILDPDGIPILGGGLDNLVTTEGIGGVPMHGVDRDIPGSWRMNGRPSLRITGNTEAGATVYVKLHGYKNKTD